MALQSRIGYALVLLLAAGCSSDFSSETEAFSTAVATGRDALSAIEQRETEIEVAMATDALLAGNLRLDGERGCVVAIRKMGEQQNRNAAADGEVATQDSSDLEGALRTAFPELADDQGVARFRAYLQEVADFCSLRVVDPGAETSVGDAVDLGDTRGLAAYGSLAQSLADYAAALAAVADPELDSGYEEAVASLNTAAKDLVAAGDETLARLRDTDEAVSPEEASTVFGPVTTASSELLRSWLELERRAALERIVEDYDPIVQRATTLLAVAARVAHGMAVRNEHSWLFDERLTDMDERARTLQARARRLPGGWASADVDLLDLRQRYLEDLEAYRAEVAAFRARSRNDPGALFTAIGTAHVELRAALNDPERKAEELFEALQDLLALAQQTREAIQEAE
ncbi:MAG: hypothetical protein GVY28_13605 [Alphaproteobacteria bacterium]|jgi:hypothetical protein|nr:hypothetical protein [Alphaproteobacteria bacterium]